MYKLSNWYYVKAGLVTSRKLKRLLSYIKENPWCSNYDKVAKKECGYPLRAKSEYTTMSLHMTKLWLDGEVEGISFGNNKWYYISVDQVK